MDEEIKFLTSSDDVRTSISSPEKTLYLAVILQALLDATKPAYHGEPINAVMERDRARAWFFASVGVTSEDFSEVCENAGVNPLYMRRFAYQVLESGEVDFVRRRINAILGH